jgi:hypothetical protein
MRFGSAVLSFLLAGAAVVSAAPIEKRKPDNIDAVIAKVKEIKADTKTLKAKVEDFEGSPLDSIAILIDNGKLDGAITDTTELVKDSKKFTTKESNKLVNTLVTIVQPTVNTLKALEDKVSACIWREEARGTNQRCSTRLSSRCSRPGSSRATSRRSRSIRTS